MCKLLLFFVLAAVAYGDDSNHCDILTEQIPQHLVRHIDSDWEPTMTQVSATRCKPAFLLKNEKVELRSYEKYMLIIGKLQDDDEERIVEVIENDKFSSLPDLEYLVVKRLDIETLEPHAFRGLNNLKSLSLASNNLKSVPVEIFEDLPNLKELNLRGNRIESIDEHLFDKATNLERLDLSVNRVPSLPVGWDAELSSLETLLLYANDFRELKSGMFENLGELRELDLDLNDIKSIEKDAFKGLEKLEHFTMFSSGAVEFDLSHELEHHLKSLKELDMRSSAPRCDDVEKAKEILDQRSVDYKLADDRCWLASES